MTTGRQKKDKARGVSDGGVPPCVPGELPLENEQHEIFVQEILLLKPQVRAYLKAYPDSSYNSARANSCALIAKDSVKDRLDFLKKERRERYRMNADDIHERLVMAVSVDPADLVDANGDPLPLHKLPPEVRLCVESIEVTERGTNIPTRRTKIETISKRAALEMLGRHQKMFTDKVEHSGKVTLEELVGGGE